MRGVGIHGKHMGPSTAVRYAASDEGRQTIPWIEYSDKHGTTMYVSPGTKSHNAASLPIREMDCIDCHNRPTHTFQLSERAVDEALASSSISPALPFDKKESAIVLKATYASSEEAAVRIPRSLVAYYHPSVYQQHKAEIANSARSRLTIYRRNVFPWMKVTLGTYPNNIGHTDFPDASAVTMELCECFRQQRYPGLKCMSQYARRGRKLAEDAVRSRNRRERHLGPNLQYNR